MGNSAEETFPPPDSATNKTGFRDFYSLIAGLRPYSAKFTPDKQSLNPTVQNRAIFRLPALQALIVRLWSIPRAQSVAATRADSILTGSVIVESLMQCLDIPKISVSSYGMRHGALLAMRSDETSQNSSAASVQPAVI